MSRARPLLAALAVVAGTSLTGCSPLRVNLRHDELRPSSRFEWRDARPVDQKGSGWESVLITSCAYGAYKIGDDKYTPDRVAVLRSDLERALGTELTGRRVVLTAYTVHLNRAARLRGGVGATHKGLIPALLNDVSVHGCAPDDLEGGYSGNENTTPFSPLIVVIDLEVDGKRIHTRWVASAAEEMGGPAWAEPSPAWNDWVSQALRNASAKAVSNFQASLAAGGAS